MSCSSDVYRQAAADHVLTQAGRIMRAAERLLRELDHDAKCGFQRGQDTNVAVETLREALKGGAA